jgi:hypothetical protein
MKTLKTWKKVFRKRSGKPWSLIYFYFHIPTKFDTAGSMLRGISILPRTLHHYASLDTTGFTDSCENSQIPSTEKKV